MTEDKNNLLLNISALYRNVNKYFDRHLSDYDIGSGQMLSLIIINEHEGLTAQQLATYAELDKGTTTKTIQKLLECGYIEVVNDQQDKRIKHLYTTSTSREIINNLYKIRNECTNQLLKDVREESEDLLDQLTANSRSFAVDDSYQHLKIAGLQKLTLLDYPGKVGCTIFTASCNLKCPFCHNKDLVFIPEGYPFYNPDEVLEFLQKRTSLLDGVCITGGEPLLQPGIFDFIDKIKSLGYLVKLDTNGSLPQQLKKAVESGNVDYVAMDIKNVWDKYSLTAGVAISDSQLKNYRKSIDFLKKSGIDYEFRTTVVKDFHTADDLKQIAKMIRGSKYFLQSFRNSGNLINPNVTGYSQQEMEEIVREVQTVNATTYLR